MQWEFNLWLQIAREFSSVWKRNFWIKYVIYLFEQLHLHCFCNSHCIEMQLQLGFNNKFRAYPPWSQLFRQLQARTLEKRYFWEPPRLQSFVVWTNQILKHHFQTPESGCLCLLNVGKDNSVSGQVKLPLRYRMCRHDSAFRLKF